MWKEEWHASGIRVAGMFPGVINFRRPPLLFVHGGCHGRWVWTQFQEFFARLGWETHALNWRNHYGSTNLDAEEFLRRGLADLADDIAIVTDRLNVPPILVGHSMGGMAAQKFVERGGIVTALALLCSVVPEKVATRKFDLSVDLKRPWGPPPFDIARKMFFPDLGHTAALSAYDHLCPESPRCVLEATLSPLDVDAEKLTCPILVVGASDDTVVPAEMARRMAGLYRATFVLMHGRGHGISFEPRWAETATMLQAWFHMTWRRGRIRQSVADRRYDGADHATK